jgi:hypothetical protein
VLETLGGVDGPLAIFLSLAIVVVVEGQREIGRRGFFVGLGVVGEPRRRLFVDGGGGVPRSEIGGDAARRLGDDVVLNPVMDCWKRGVVRGV